MFKKIFLLSFIINYSCKSKVETIKPTFESITESIYASGIIKSKNQYQAFATVNGIVKEIYVTEGDTVQKGTPILSIANDAQKLSKENAELAANFSSFNNNQDKLNESKMLVELAENKLKNDSALYFRQKNLWQQQIGTKVEFEQRELAYLNSRAALFSAKVRFKDLKRQLDFNSSQSKNNLQITSKLESDYILKSEIDGIVYNITKSKGEIVGAQTSVAIIGDAKNFILEMQVDEYDILKISKNMAVMVTLDSYRGKVFEARVSKINPIMNERSKTFLVEALFTKAPEVLFPNINFEANIVLNTKNKSILIPRSYLIGDSLVIKKNGDTIKVKTGLKDYQKIEILSGITREMELKKPTQ